MTTSWQPTADIQTLKQRAQFMANIRQFFADKNVLEVETPMLSNGTITDLHLEAFETQFGYHSSGQPHSLYLQTSPEFAMKRLLAAGSGCIYQICKAFRNEAAGRFHNPEFTMLEWYRVGFTDQDLMAELDELVQAILTTPPAHKLTYQNAFLDHLNIDPLSISLKDLKTEITKYSNDAWLLAEDNKDTLLQWLFSSKIEPSLGITQGENPDSVAPCFVYNFPASQAALAKINDQDPRVAHRFELYYKGVELANGFYELQDACEQAERFNTDNNLRKTSGLTPKPIDKHFIAALEHGLPNCAGVALGLDRLFMLKAGKSQIADTISFNINRA